MYSAGKGANDAYLESLFREETPYHIHESITTMEDEIYGECNLKLGPEVTISNYWRLKFILARAMSERESFGDYMKLTVSTFKEEAEGALVHTMDFMPLSEPPFQHANKDTKETDTNKANEDEAESFRKI